MCGMRALFKIMSNHITYKCDLQLPLSIRDHTAHVGGCDSPPGCAAYSIVRGRAASVAKRAIGMASHAPAAIWKSGGQGRPAQFRCGGCGGVRRQWALAPVLINGILRLLEQRGLLVWQQGRTLIARTMACAWRVLHQSVLPVLAAEQRLGVREGGAICSIMVMDTSRTICLCAHGLHQLFVGRKVWSDKDVHR